jgi:predicted nucleic acid-binding protein
MKIIIDTNILLAVILNEPEKERLIEITKGIELVSPEIMPYEIGNALSAMIKRKRLNKEQVLKSFSIYNLIPVKLIKTDIFNALALACELNIYAYDAYYLEASRRLKLPLLTLDRLMKENAAKLNLKTWEV